MKKENKKNISNTSAQNLIWFSQEPPYAPGYNPQLITLEELAKRCNFTLLNEMEIDENVPITEDEKSLFAAVSQKFNNKSVTHKLVVCSGLYGYEVHAKERIAKDEIIGIYYGVLKSMDDIDKRSPYNLLLGDLDEGKYFIDSASKGGVSRLLPHLPYPKEDADIETIKELLLCEKKQIIDDHPQVAQLIDYTLNHYHLIPAKKAELDVIAQENVEFLTHEIPGKNKLAIPYFVALEDIPEKALVGFTYSPIYWSALVASPMFFNNTNGQPLITAYPYPDPHAVYLAMRNIAFLSSLLQRTVDKSESFLLTSPRDYLKDFYNSLEHKLKKNLYNFIQIIPKVNFHCFEQVYKNIKLYDETAETLFNHQPALGPCFVSFLLFVLRENSQIKNNANTNSNSNQIALAEYFYHYSEVTALFKVCEMIAPTFAPRLITALIDQEKEKSISQDDLQQLVAMHYSVWYWHHTRSANSQGSYFSGIANTINRFFSWSNEAHIPPSTNTDQQSNQENSWCTLV